MRIHIRRRSTQAVYRLLRPILGCLALLSGLAATASEDIEFASEHLGEVGLENRFATLPMWGEPDEGRRWSTLAQLGYILVGLQWAY